MTLVLWLASCRLIGLVSEGPLAEDLTVLCRVAGRVEKETPGDSGGRLAAIVRESAKEKVGPAGKALLTAIQNAPPAARKKVLQEVLEKNGLEDVRCPVLRDALLQG